MVRIVRSGGKGFRAESRAGLVRFLNRFSGL